MTAGPETHLTLRGWLLAGICLAGLMIGVAMIFASFFGASIAYLLIGCVLCAAAAACLLEIGRRTGAPRQGLEALVPTLAAVSIVVAWMATGSVWLLVLWPSPFLVWAVWRLREPVCPHCGRPGTFGPTGDADVCERCGFDFRRDSY